MISEVNSHHNHLTKHNAEGSRFCQAIRTLQLFSVALVEAMPRRRSYDWARRSRFARVLQHRARLVRLRRQRRALAAITPWHGGFVLGDFLDLGSEEDDEPVDADGGVLPEGDGNTAPDSGREQDWNYLAACRGA